MSCVGSVRLLALLMVLTLLVLLALLALLALLTLQMFLLAILCPWRSLTTCDLPVCTNSVNTQEHCCCLPPTFTTMPPCGECMTAANGATIILSTFFSKV